MTRRRATRWAPGALLALVGCAGPALEAPYYEDLILGGALQVAGRQVEPAEVHCPDTSHLGLRLVPGKELAAPFSGDPSARLFLSACAAEAAAGELVVEARGAGGGKVRERLPLSFSEHGSFEATVDLSGLPAGEARLHLTFSGGGKLLLRDLYVERRRELRAAAEARQVLLISADTLREDAVLAPGERYPIPHLERFQAESQVFTPHYAGATWTLPSHASMLTGQGVDVHGVVSRKKTLRPGVRTLAERFRDAGFATEGLVYDCLWLDPRVGFDRGFGGYRSVRWDLPKMVRQVSNWIVDHRDEPFFYFFHTFETHSDRHRIPYESPGTTAAVIEAEYGVADYGCRGSFCASRLLRQIGRGKVPLLAGESELLEHLYRRGVTRADHELGILFENLRQAGLFRRMTVVLTSDHGESFEGLGRFQHGDPWEEILRVPLLVKWPHNVRAGERREGATSAVDVAATLAAELGLDAADLPGTHLLAPRRPGASIFSGTYPRIVLRGGYKAIFPLEGAPLLFDLRRDPGEREDLSGRHPEIVDELAGLLARKTQADRRIAAEIQRREKGENAHSWDRGEIERLESLGYVDSER